MGAKTRQLHDGSVELNENLRLYQTNLVHVGAGELDFEVVRQLRETGGPEVARGGDEGMCGQLAGGAAQCLGVAQCLEMMRGLAQEEVDQLSKQLRATYLGQPLDGRPVEHV